MKTIFILCGLVLAGGLVWFLLSHRHPDHFGNDFRGFPPIELAKLVDKPADHVKKEVRIEGTLSKK